MIHPGARNEGSALHASKPLTRKVLTNFTLGNYNLFPGGKLNHLKYLLSPVTDLESLTSFLMRFYLVKDL